MAGTRRHGAELQRALLDAAWDELLANGYASFTMDAVADRAGTSRPVLYRRWSDKYELIRAAVAHAVDRDSIPIPDTGSLRGDTIALLRNANRTRLSVAAVINVHLAGFYRDTGTSPADLRDSVLGGRPRTARIVLDRAVARGEIPPDPISDRVATLPYTLLQHEFLLTLKTVPMSVIEQIVDTVFLPLVTGRSYRLSLARGPATLRS